MKTYRKVYEKEVCKVNSLSSDFVPTESQFQEFEIDIKIETKEEDGVKIDFVLHNNVLIGALYTEEAQDVENEKLDSENYNLAYNDFQAWLNC